jgi:hypothetical protein
MSDDDAVPVRRPGDDDRDVCVYDRMLRSPDSKKALGPSVLVFLATDMGWYYLELRDDRTGESLVLPGIRMSKDDAIARADRVNIW